MQDELRAFAEWLKAKGELVKQLTVDKLVEEFKREQAIREAHQSDEGDPGRVGR